MKPLIVLLSIFAMSLFLIKWLQGKFEFLFSARLAMSAMLVFTAVGHFAFTKGMTMMLPEFIPYKAEVVLITGLMEIAAAIGLHIVSIRKITAWLLIIFFIIILPANIYAAMNQVDYQNGTFHGNGLNYLWFRIPLQIFLIGWIYLFVLKQQPINFKK